MTMRLTIRVSDKSLSFSTFTTADGGHCEYEPYPTNNGISMAANLRQSFGESRLLGRGYKDALFIMDEPTLIIPIEEYEENDISLLYNHVFRKGKGNVIMHSVLPNLNAVAAFAVNNDLKLVADDNFEHVDFIPLMQPVWNYLHKRSFTGPHKKLYAFFHDKHLELASFRQNRFRFSNRFSAAHYRDAVYYIMYVWNQLGLNPMTDELHIVGADSDRTELLLTLRQYLKKVYELNPSADFGFVVSGMDGGMPFDLKTFYAKGK
ncbi:MAG: DUF3822 family protein [Prevotella sp.]